MRRLLDRDLASGIVEVFHHDPLADVSTIETRHDCEPLIEHNKRLATADDGWSPSRELRRVGSIPFGVYLQWLAEGFDALDPNNTVELKRRLNDPDWRWLKTSPGAA